MLSHYFVPSIFYRGNAAAGSGARGRDHCLWGSCQLDARFGGRQDRSLQGEYHWSTRPHGKRCSMHNAMTWGRFCRRNGWVKWCEEGGLLVALLDRRGRFLHLSLPCPTANPTCLYITIKESYSPSHMTAVFPHLQYAAWCSLGAVVVVVVMGVDMHASSFCVFRAPRSGQAH